MNKQLKDFKASKDKDMTNEIMRAGTFFQNQLKKGWSVRDSFDQMESSYGHWVAHQVALSFNRVLTN